MESLLQRFGAGSSADISNSTLADDDPGVAIDLGLTPKNQITQLTEAFRHTIALGKPSDIEEQDEKHPATATADTTDRFAAYKMTNVAGGGAGADKSRKNNIAFKQKQEKQQQRQTRKQHPAAPADGYNDHPIQQRKQQQQDHHHQDQQRHGGSSGSANTIEDNIPVAHSGSKGTFTLLPSQLFPVSATKEVKVGTTTTTAAAATSKNSQEKQRSKGGGGRSRNSNSNLRFVDSFSSSTSNSAMSAVAGTATTATTFTSTTSTHTVTAATEAAMRCNTSFEPTCDMYPYVRFWNKRFYPEDCYQSPLKAKINTPWEDQKYLIFEPDHGGWNNIRMAAETAMIFAHASGRTLVLPPVMNFYLLDKNSKAEENRVTFEKFFDMRKISEGVNIISMEEFIQHVARPGLLKLPFPEGLGSNKGE